MTEDAQDAKERAFFLEAHEGHVTEQLGAGDAKEPPGIVAHVDNRDAAASVRLKGRRHPTCQTVYAGRVRFSKAGEHHVLGFKVNTPGLAPFWARAHLGVERVFLREQADRSEVCETPLLSDIEIMTRGSQIWIKCTRAEARRLSAMDVSYFITAIGVVTYLPHEGGKPKTHSDLSWLDQLERWPGAAWRWTKSKIRPTAFTFLTALAAIGLAQAAPALWRWTVTALEFLRDQVGALLG